MGHFFWKIRLHYFTLPGVLDQKDHQTLPAAATDAHSSLALQSADQDLSQNFVLVIDVDWT